MLIGVPDYIPIPAIEGNVELLPTAFGLLDASLLNVSKVKTGYVTCARLYYKKGPVLYAYLHWRSQAAAQVGRIWVGALLRRSCQVWKSSPIPARGQSLRSGYPAST